MAVKQFVVGKEPYPIWFRELAEKGRARINVDEDGVLQNITVHTPTKNYVAKPGDTIVLKKSGMTVLESKAVVKNEVPKKEG